MRAFSWPRPLLFVVDMLLFVAYRSPMPRLLPLLLLALAGWLLVAGIWCVGSAWFGMVAQIFTR
jgi:hypothetical protein